MSITIESPGLLPLGMPTAISSDTFARSFVATLEYIQRRAWENPALSFRVIIKDEPIYWPDVERALNEIQTPGDRVAIDFVFCSIGGATSPVPGQVTHVPKARA